MKRCKAPPPGRHAKQCGHILTIEKPEAAVDAAPEPLPETVPEAAGYQATQEIETPSPDQAQKSAPEPPVTDLPQSDAKPTKPRKISAPSVKTKGLGLRSKMILLFLLVPLILMAASGYIAQRQIHTLSAGIAADSAAIVAQIAEDNIASTARAVARECQLYLADNPQLRSEDFDSDPLLKELANQKVGKTGYTALYAVGPFTTWVHPNPKVKGVPISQVMKKPLGSEYAKFFKIISAAEKGKNVERSGYYLWQDKDGVKREKFMVISPIRGTRYGIAATTYIHEFTQPLKKLERPDPKGGHRNPQPQFRHYDRHLDRGRADRLFVRPPADRQYQTPDRCCRSHQRR